MLRRNPYHHHTSVAEVLKTTVCLLIYGGGLLSAGFLLLWVLGIYSPKEGPSGMPTEIEAATPAASHATQEALEPFRGVFLSLDALEDAAQVSRGYDGVLLTMKDRSGKLGYVSNLPVAMEVGTSFSNPERNECLEALNKQEGVYSVAVVSCLRDKRLVRAEPSWALCRPSGSPWLDNAGVGCLDPANEEVQTYLLGLCRELAVLGFDEILLTDCSYPITTQAMFGDAEEKKAHLDTLCRRIQGALADFPTTLSLSAETKGTELRAESGQSPTLLASFGRIWTDNPESLAAFSPSILPKQPE